MLGRILCPVPETVFLVINGWARNRNFSFLVELKIEYSISVNYSINSDMIQRELQQVTGASKRRPHSESGRPLCRTS